MTTTEGNKLIAKFMGLPLQQMVYQYNESFNVDVHYNYNGSWDELMKVIDKIEQSNFADYNFNYNITGDGVCISKFDDGSGIIANRANKWGESKLKASWECVIEFIQWYNTTKTPAAI